ncbi:ABC transporter permease [Oribacterium sinus]|uniref:ABC transporter permease n=1 Tax=Oribacterium sinus TaxID=237576 RepID=UPI0028EB2147|nr:ABC transporter permease [Oribacterium sinus]
MKGFFAAIWKDGRLFLRKGGLFILLFPLLLFPLFAFFFRGQSGQMQAFPVMVIDEDQTIMSKTLIREMEKVELFSTVIKEEEEIGQEGREKAFQEGVVGILRIPKDFFYTAYRFEGEPVDLSLNANRPTESLLFQSIFTSIMEIMEKEQEISKGVFHALYGESLSKQEEESLYEHASERLLTAVLKRQLVFDEEGQSSQVEKALSLRIFSFIFFFLLAFCALSSVFSVPEEEKKGIPQRFALLGGRGFFLSKLFFLFLSALPLLLLCLFALKKSLDISLEQLMPIAFIFCVELLSFFFFFYQLFRIMGEESTAKLLSFSLLFLGILYTGKLFGESNAPEFVKRLSPITVNRMVLEGVRRGLSFSTLLSTALPLLLWDALALALGILSGIYFKLKTFFKQKAFSRKLRRESKRQYGQHGQDGQYGQDRPDGQYGQYRPSGQDRQDEQYGQDRQDGQYRQYRPDGQDKSYEKSALPFPCSLLSLRFSLLLGGGRGFLLLVLFLLSLFAYSRVGGKEKLSLMLVREDQGAWSEELIQELQQEKGLQVEVVENQEAKKALLEGSVEGVLWIKEGFTGDTEGRGSLHYESSADSLAEMGIREIVAALSSTLRMEKGALAYGESLLGRSLNETEKEAIEESIVKSKRTEPLYQIQELKGERGRSLFQPKREAVLGFVLYFFLFSLGTALGREEEKRVFQRSRTYPVGRIRYHLSGILLFGLLSLGFFLALEGRTILGIEKEGGLRLAVLYKNLLLPLLCTLGFSFFLYSFARRLSYSVFGAEMAGGLSLSLGLLFSFLGGSFVDFSSLSNIPSFIPYLSPIGIYQMGMEGQPLPMGMLVLFSVLLL